MGEVWRARDPKLGRDVAIKVLPATLSADKDRLARFEQEAQAAGALNHPNIITIHKIGEFEGTHFIATEFIDVPWAVRFCAFGAEIRGFHTSPRS